MSENEKVDLEGIDLEAFILKYLEDHDIVQPADIKDLVRQGPRTISSHLSKMGAAGLLEKTTLKGHVAWKKPHSPMMVKLIEKKMDYERELKMFQYIPLRCTDGDSREMLLDEMFNEWYSADGQLLVLLGEYGSGKTSYAKNLYCQLAERYLEDELSERMPIHLSLKDNLLARGSILRQIGDKLDMSDVHGKKNLRELNRKGKLLFILDRFDEMPRTLEEQETHEKFNMLKEIFEQKSKIILTSRTSYFRDRMEEESVCRTTDPSFTGFLMNTNNTKTFYISDLNTQDVNSYLRQHYGKNWKRKRKKIDNIALLLKGAIEARVRVGLKMNVAQKNLDAQ